MTRPEPAQADGPARVLPLIGGLAAAVAFAVTHGRAQAVIALIFSVAVVPWCGSPSVAGVGLVDAPAVPERVRRVLRVRKAVAVVALSAFMATLGTDLRWIGFVLTAVAFAVAYVTDAQLE